MTAAIPAAIAVFLNRVSMSSHIYNAPHNWLAMERSGIASPS